MFNSIVLDVVIGLVFIYLLYSLLVTILSELIATFLSLKSRNLKEGIDRMLNDEKLYERWEWLARFWDSFNFIKSPKNPVIDAFYNHPEIKYQGSSGVFKYPSNFKATSFSKTLMSLLIGNDPLTRETLAKKLKNNTIDLIPLIKIEESPEKPIHNKFFKKVKLLLKWLFEPKRSSLQLEQTEKTEIAKAEIRKIYTDCHEDWEKVKPELINYLNESDKVSKSIKVGNETAIYLRSLWQESQGDLDRFKTHLEAWFERTMAQNLEWYSRKIRVVTFVLGFLVAWFFNADTFMIVKSLSTDKDAREQMVSMANSYVENNKTVIDNLQVKDTVTMMKDLNTKLDSLLAVKKQLQEDIYKANNILGFGCWPPDSVQVSIDQKTKAKLYSPPIDGKSLRKKDRDDYTNTQIYFSFSAKLIYMFRLFVHHFLGFLLTAIAISLGAPFWFDLLNKMMKLRTAQKEEIKNPDGSSPNTEVSSLNRVG